MPEKYPIIAIDQLNSDEAYQRVLPEAMGLTSEALVTINVDVPTCIVTCFTVLERLPAFRVRIQQLPELPNEQMARFPDYVLALFNAQARYTIVTAPLEALPALLAQATRRRSVFVAEAKAMVVRGDLNGRPLKELKRRCGYNNVAFDLSALTHMFKNAWPAIEGKTSLRMTEIEDAAGLALRLAAAIAHQDNSKEAVAAAIDIRQRMFTILCATYGQIRRAVTYLRWDEGDADCIVPSLYSGRHNSNAPKKKGNGAEQPPTDPSVASPFVLADSPGGDEQTQNG